MFKNANGQGIVENLRLKKAQAPFLTSYSLIIIGLLDCISKQLYLISRPPDLIGLYILTTSFFNISQIDLLYKQLKRSDSKNQEKGSKNSRRFSVSSLPLTG
jgi:hypothetical protein